MNLAGYGEELKTERLCWLLSFFMDREEAEQNGRRIRDAREEMNALFLTAEVISGEKGCRLPEDRDGKQKRLLLYALYENLRDPELSIRKLACEVLFMNEDYFGRLFRRLLGQKFNQFLQTSRVQLVQRLLQYNPELLLQDIAAELGYAPDGQYLSKAFRKETGISPTEYRRRLIQQSDFSK